MNTVGAKGGQRLPVNLLGKLAHCGAPTNPQEGLTYETSRARLG